MSTRTILAAIAVFSCIAAAPAFGQSSRFTVNFGVGMGFNQGQIASLVDTSGSIVLGVGYHLSDTIAAVAEYQYYNLAFKESIDDPFNPNEGIGQLDSVSANALIKINNKVGAYGIGGVGWYRRYVRIEGPSIVPAFVADPALGFNLGAGVTFPFGGRFKLYGELRYHHAYNRVVPTIVLPVTFGIRW